jgi:hypothetical protein
MNLARPKSEILSNAPISLLEYRRFSGFDQANRVPLDHDEQFPFYGSKRVHQ